MNVYYSETGAKKIPYKREKIIVGAPVSYPNGIDYDLCGILSFGRILSKNKRQIEKQNNLYVWGNEESPSWNSVVDRVFTETC